MPDTTLRVLIHAPTPDALRRARNNASNLLKAEPAAQIEIIANAGAVAAALAEAHPTDSLLHLCLNTLQANKLTAPQTLRTVRAAVLHLAQRQADGWAYIRA